MSVAIGERQATFCATFVDELVLGGVGDAVLCPGSRSTPLALAVAASSLRCHVRLDERSAGFFAVGLARATGRPVLVVVTSGTAAAELHASVVEADLDRVPLIVATADRPPELQSVGSAQTIEQAGIFGSQLRFSSLPGPCHAWPEELWRPLASRVVLEAVGFDGRPGPVHLNLPFAEPLVAEPGALPPSQRPGQPHYAMTAPRQGSAVLAGLGARGVVLAGHGCGDPERILAATARLRWPLLADPRSGCRRSDPQVVAAADGLLRMPELVELLVPETLVLLGAPPASKVVGEWITAVAQRGARVVVLGHDGPARHPTQVSALFLRGEPASLLEQFSEELEEAPPAWLERWKSFERAAQAGIDELLGDGLLCEPSLARALSRELEGAILVSSSSMPIRDLEWFGVTRPRPLRVLANRGANGIDGVLSTAMGVAAGSSDPVVALVGDLAFFHDVSALVDGLPLGGSLVVVVVDNRGGGIFSFLPQATSLDAQRFEQLFGTPRAVSVLEVARGFGVEAQMVESHGSLREALAEQVGSEGIHVLVVRVPNRESNVARHEQLHRAIDAAARAMLS
jgi:2-succinyl-5-enolpyruvyl-6-hydroxy-3-cyclohexene-1-carboxylate synthase